MPVTVLLIPGSMEVLMQMLKYQVIPGTILPSLFQVPNVTECVVYIDGEVAKQGDFGGIDWTGCDILTIMSGAPRFTGWSHFSDEGLMDELRIFNKALTQEDVQQIIADES
jgi:hypothetical protein